MRFHGPLGHSPQDTHIPNAPSPELWWMWGTFARTLVIGREIDMILVIFKFQIGQPSPNFVRFRQTSSNFLQVSHAGTPTRRAPSARSRVPDRLPTRFCKPKGRSTPKMTNELENQLTKQNMPAFVFFLYWQPVKYNSHIFCFRDQFPKNLVVYLRFVVLVRSLYRNTLDMNKNTTEPQTHMQK